MMKLNRFARRTLQAAALAVVAITAAAVPLKPASAGGWHHGWYGGPRVYGGVYFGGQGSLYRSQHELVFLFKLGNGKHQNHIQLGHYGRYRTNVWSYPRVNSFSHHENLSVLHPTIKPTTLIADAIMDCSSRRDIILDPFLGSGSTLVACERTDRVCAGLELEPVYVDVAVRRWQAYTGKPAVLSGAGETFETIEEQRAPSAAVAA